MEGGNTGGKKGRFPDREKTKRKSYLLDVRRYRWGNDHSILPPDPYIRTSTHIQEKFREPKTTDSTQGTLRKSRVGIREKT